MQSNDHYYNKMSRQLIKISYRSASALSRNSLFSRTNISNQILKDTPTVKRLITTGNWDHNILLEKCVFWGHADTAKMLLEKCTKSAIDQALLYAIIEDHYDVTKVLVEGGARLSAKCLSAAVNGPNVKIVNLLLDHDVAACTNKE